MYLSVSLSIIIGIILGLGFSIVFGVYNKSTTDNKLYKLFGMRSDALVTAPILFAIVSGTIALTGMSFVIRDTEYITEYPIKFLLELLYISITPALIVFMMAKFRNDKITLHTWQEFVLVAAKFMLFHILLQLSGFYRSIFGI